MLIEKKFLIFQDQDSYACFHLTIAVPTEWIHHNTDIKKLRNMLIMVAAVKRYNLFCNKTEDDKVLLRHQNLIVEVQVIRDTFYLLQRRPYLSIPESAMMDVENTNRTKGNFDSLQITVEEYHDAGCCRLYNKGRKILCKEQNVVIAESDDDSDESMEGEDTAFEGEGGNNVQMVGEGGIEKEDEYNLQMEGEGEQVTNESRDVEMNEGTETNEEIDENKKLKMPNEEEEKEEENIQEGEITPS